MSRSLALLLLVLPGCAASSEAVLERRHERVAQLGLATFVAENTDRRVRVVHCDVAVLAPFDPVPAESRAIELDALQRDRLSVDDFRLQRPAPSPLRTLRDGGAVRLAMTDGALTVDLEARADWARRLVELVVETVHAGARSSNSFVVEDGGAVLVPFGLVESRFLLMVSVGMVALKRRSAADGAGWIDERAAHPAGDDR